MCTVWAMMQTYACLLQAHVDGDIMPDRSLWQQLPAKYLNEFIRGEGQCDMRLLTWGTTVNPNVLVWSSVEVNREK